jgi:hypothetical protein
MAWNTPFDEWPEEQQREWRFSANEWYSGHSKHVERLLQEESTSYPPSGSDCGKPELWKSGHWRWHFKLGNK